MKKKFIFNFLCLLVTLLVTAKVKAQEPFLWIDVGAKGALGANYLTPPDDALPNLSLPFQDGAGGLGGGGGIFTELRILKQHLGLETGLLIDTNKTWCNITYFGVIETDFILKYTSMRIPLMIKAYANKGITRIGIGIGPEFQIGVKASRDAQITKGKEYASQDQEQLFKESLNTHKKNYVALAWSLSMGFDLKILTLTTDLKFAYNLSMPKEYLERGNLTIIGDEGTLDVQAGHTIDARLMLGLAYNFKISK